MMAVTLLGNSLFALPAQPPEPLPFPIWDRLFTVRTGFGYKDNLTYSSFRPESSSFFAGGADAIFSRLSPGETQYTFFLSGDEIRYFSAQTVDHELLGFAQAQIKKPFAESLLSALTFDYMYNDQVLDVSVTETNRLALPVTGHALSLRPSLRFNLSPQFWVAFEPGATRQFFSPIDDYWEFGPRFTLGHSYAPGSEITLSFEANTRAYDTDPQLTRDAQPIPGTQRTFLFQDVRAAWRHQWDSAGHWRTITRLGYKHNDDQGAGYFSYDRLSAGQAVRFHTESFDISAEAKISYYHYPVQTVSATNLAKRERTEMFVILRAERRLTSWLKLVAAFEYEPTRSNDPLEKYTAQTFSGGLEFEF